MTPTKICPPYGAGGFLGHLDPELVEVAKELSLAIVTWDIDTEDWKVPQGLGPEKISKIESQFTQQPRQILIVQPLGNGMITVGLVLTRPTNLHNLTYTMGSLL